MEPVGELSLEKRDNILFLYYYPKSDYVMYDLCNRNGKICLSGEIAKEPPTKANLQSLPKGDYQIFIIDGEDIIKKAIKL